MKTKTDFKKEVEKKGHHFYGDARLVSTYKEGRDGELAYFKLDKYVTAKELADEYKKRGLTPAHPSRLLEDWDGEKLVATQWEDDGFCFATFGRWDDGERDVSVDRDDDDWDGSWWLGGVSKESLARRIKRIQEHYKTKI